MPLRPSSRAFTLIELLTVIAITGVLAAILIPVIGAVRKSAQSSQCVSNLRQIGVAISLYANDNRGTLPGPLWARHGVGYRSTSDGNLAKFLAPAYLPSVDTGGGLFSCELFKCPGWAATEATHYQSILSNITPWRDSKGVTHFPFGDAANPVARPPMTMTMLSQYPLARTWMLVDMDNPLMAQLGWGTSPQLPQKTVHGSSRNVLFFDGHVTAIPDSTPLTFISVP